RLGRADPGTHGAPGERRPRTERSRRDGPGPESRRARSSSAVVDTPCAARAAPRRTSLRGRRSLDAGPQPAIPHVPPAVAAGRGAWRRAAAGAPLLTARRAPERGQRRRPAPRPPGPAGLRGLPAGQSLRAAAGGHARPAVAAPPPVRRRGRRRLPGRGRPLPVGPAVERPAARPFRRRLRRPPARPRGAGRRTAGPLRHALGPHGPGTAPGALRPAVRHVGLLLRPVQLALRRPAAGLP